ncbi:hypothetical protein EI94DRAFT_1697595 [Lactarius quietus]|nr:hypothetical protein EI94DRAFT_1697595 [Lactarius quietus]
MVKLQSHKKIVIESDSRRQTSADAKQAVLSSRDPRTVCMTEDELAYLRASFRVNRWPERAEKERLARTIGKSYEKVHHWFSNQRQKMALVEKALQHPPTSETPPQPRNFSIVHMTEATSAKNSPEECRGIPERPDVSVENGARLLLEFVANVRAAHRTPSPSSFLGEVLTSEFLPGRFTNSE